MLIFEIKTYEVDRTSTYVVFVGQLQRNLPRATTKAQKRIHRSQNRCGMESRTATNGLLCPSKSGY